MFQFQKGLEIMIIPALVIGFARGIQGVMLEGQILDTILNATANGMEQLPKILAAEGMFILPLFLVTTCIGFAAMSVAVVIAY